MVNLIPMQFENAAIRVVDVDGEPWFVGKDVAEALGYTNANKAMGDHCKGVTKRHPLATAGGPQDLRILSEGDVLRLVVASKLPAAERFERWIFDEVIPTVRRTGAYTLPSKQRPQLSIIASDFRAASSIARTAGLKDNHARISAARIVEERHGVDPLKLAGVTHQVAEDQVRHLTPTQLGEKIGMKPRAFNALLADKGLQVRDGAGWKATAAGERYSVILDTEKRTNGGTPILQLKWLETVLGLLETKAA